MAMGRPKDSDYRLQASLKIALTALVVLTPFSINNFYQTRYLLGVGCVFILSLLTYNAWSVYQRNVVPWTTPGLLCPAIVGFLATSFAQQGVVGAFWCYPALISFYFMLSERHARLLNLVLLCAIIPVAFHTISTPLAIRVTATLFAVSIFSGFSIRVITEQQRRLGRMAVRDPLTGLYNRALLEPALETALEQSRRSSSPLSLIVMDLDRFKSINDNYGHDGGDRVLREVGNLLRTRLRQSDQVFRLGGEEFLIVLFQTEKSTAQMLAEEIRGTLSSLEILPGRPVTASLGVSGWRQHEHWQELLKRADTRLYEAKSQGRNQVVS